MAGSRVVVLGGGFGGAAAALEAHRLLGDGHRVTLVDRSRIGHLCGANPLIMVGAASTGSASRSLDAVEEAGVEVMIAEIEGIDTQARMIATSDGRLEFDHLVVALGVSYDWTAVPGADDAYSFYDHPSTLRLRERLAGFDSGTVVVAIAGTPYRCPPAPLEGALMIDWELRRRGVRDRCRIHVAIPEPKPLGVAGPEASARVAGLLEQRGIELRTGARLTEVVGGGSGARLSDGSEMAADVVIQVPVHRVPEVVSGAGLATPEGWVAVDADTLETSVDRVFAIGDVNSIPIPPNRAIPKAGVFAADQGRVAAGVIAARISGTDPPPRYEGAGHCFIAFSGTEAAQVGGTFLADGGPQVGLGPTEDIGIKQRWEGAWRSFRV